MNMFRKERNPFGSIAKVDTDIIALCVLPNEVEDIVEYLTAAIVARCLMDFGETPEIL